METGLILVIPEAEPLVCDLRALHDPKAAEGVPAHITALYPFRPSGVIDEAVRARLKGLLAQIPAMRLRFGSVGRFPGVRWLAPEPRERLDLLTLALARAFPDCPPYQGKYPDPIPHLTVAMDEDETTLRLVELQLAERLVRPLHARVDSCSLFARTGEGWRETERFALGPAEA